MAGFRKCPLCGASVRLTNLDQHARRAHPGEKVGWKLTAEEQSAVDEGRRPPARLGRRERLLYPVLGIAVVVGIVLGAVIFAPPHQPPGPDVAPNFTLSSSEGETVRLWDFRGSLVLLDFMDTHCSHCQQETLEVLRPLYGAYGDRVVFLSVDVGFIGPPDDFADIRSFKAAYGAAWTYLLDDGTVAPEYAVTSTPTTFILREDLTVHSRFVGSTSYDVLSSAVEAALGRG